MTWGLREGPHPPQVPIPAPVPAPLPAPALAAPAPIPVPAPAPLPSPALPAPTLARAKPPARVAAAVLLASIGVALAAVGMVETVGYSWRVGGEVFAALAVCADGLGLAMPSAIAALWRRRRTAAIAAAAMWLVGSVVTVANLSGYIGAHDDTFTAKRQEQALGRSVTLEQLERLRAERASIREQRPAAAIAIAARNAKRSARPALQESLAIAQRRDAIDAELRRPLPALADTTTADPSASVLSQITGTTVSETDLRRLRLLAWLLLPLCGGGVLSIALALGNLTRPPT